MQKDFPRNLCSIDITYRSNETKTEWIPLFIGALMIEKQENSYKIKSHKFFPLFIEPLKKMISDDKAKEFFKLSSQEFISFLNDFDGLIIGHNIINEYDNINKSWEKTNVSLKIDTSISNKTIDLWQFANAISHSSSKKYSKKWFLYKKPNSLENLCKRNLKLSKKDIGNQEKKWDNGNTLEVILHNQQDCELAYQLWWHLLHNNIMKVEHNPWPKKHPRYDKALINKYLLKNNKGIQ